MSIRDSQNGYSWLSIALHWIAAITVITLYLIAEVSEDLPKAERKELMSVHVSIAMSLYIILWGRIFWRMGNARPALPPQHPVLVQLSRWVPILLLAGIAIMLVSGPLMVWSNGSDINIFNAVTLPTMMEKNHDLHEFFEEVHEFGANVLLLAFALHILGAIKHLVVKSDGTLRRMFIPGNH